jgi:hypothetical protein
MTVFDIQYDYLPIYHFINRWALLCIVKQESVIYVTVNEYSLAYVQYVNYYMNVTVS